MLFFLGLNFCLCIGSFIHSQGRLKDQSWLVGFRIVNLDLPVELLQSEVQVQGLSSKDHRFSITNDSVSEGLKVSVISKSCGCSAVTLDGEFVQVDHSVSMSPRESKQLTLTVPIPNRVRLIPGTCEYG